MRRFPELFGRLNPESYKHIQIAKTADGAYCYISIKDGPQKAVALTDHLAPVKRAGDALNYNPRLQKELAPAVVVGLAPGIILDSVVKSFKDKQKLGHPFRPIYVIIDSLECLYAWLTACDRREILSHPDILFFWHEDLGKLVKLCESDINRSHLFIPISALPDQVSNKIIEPLAKFYLAREAQAKIWKSENDQYYNSMSDEELARIIAGKAGRKPRLLMPTHTSSTVIQYSTRDACAMFEKAGWETKIAKINWDFTLWRAAKEVNDFKPDMIIFINYLRSSFMDSIPENLLFVTWIQDTMSHLNQAKVAEEWNKNTVKPHCVTGIPKKRDFLIGYTDIVEPYGYLKERMIQLPMVVNTDIFHPRELTEEQKKKYGCDICFASNRGLPTEEMMKLEFLPPFTNKFLFDEKTCWQIHDELWKHYRAGNTLTGYPSLKNFLTVKVPTFLSCLEKNSPEDQELAIQRIFWILNDVIYRHIVLEWCDELGLKINLYGKGWEQHPRFKKYAKGIIAHGEELSIAYQAAKFCLHLNSIEGTHQRLNEIIASGAIPLIRENGLPYEAKSFIPASIVDYCTGKSWFQILLNGESEHPSDLASGLTTLAYCLTYQAISEAVTDSDLLKHRIIKEIQEIMATLVKELRFARIPEIKYRNKEQLSCLNAETESVKALWNKLSEGIAEFLSSELESIIDPSENSLFSQKILHDNGISIEVLILELNDLMSRKRSPYEIKAGRILDCDRIVEFISHMQGTGRKKEAHALLVGLNQENLKTTYGKYRYIFSVINGLPQSRQQIVDLVDSNRNLKVSNFAPADQLKWVRILLSAGCIEEARNILLEFSPSKTTESEVLEQYHYCLYNAELLEKRLEFLESPVYKTSAKNLATFKAITYIRMQKLDEAEKAIGSEKIPLFSSFLLYLKGDFQAAIELCNEESQRVENGDFLISLMLEIKARAERAAGRYEEALESAKAAFSMLCNAVYAKEIWWEEFEIRRTLFMKDKDLYWEKILEKSKLEENTENIIPLWIDIMERKRNGRKFTENELKSLMKYNNSYLSSSCFSYRAYAILLIAALQKNSGLTAESEDLIKSEFIKDPSITSISKAKIERLIAEKTLWTENGLDELSGALYPFHPLESGERALLKNELEFILS